MRLYRVLALIPFLLFGGCATSPPHQADSPLIPLQKANLEAVFEEQEGLEILWENAQEVRDFYRGGVQQKAKADKDYQDKKYPEALKKYDSSNEFFMVVLKYSNEDICECILFDETSILFFPNLLIADNHLKAGKILKEMARDSSAQRKWKQALPYVQRSLQREKTEWGLAVQQELHSLLGTR
jgi:tetratricopeptide (TPR) repeat protein